MELVELLVLCDEQSNVSGGRRLAGRALLIHMLICAVIDCRVLGSGSCFDVGVVWGNVSVTACRRSSLQRWNHCTMTQHRIGHCGTSSHVFVLKNLERGISVVYSEIVGDEAPILADCKLILCVMLV